MLYYILLYTCSILIEEMDFIFYDPIFVFKNYNIFILYDYRYYCDFKMLVNLCIQ